jgi:hypothetical protein
MIAFDTKRYERHPILSSCKLGALFEQMRETDRQSDQALGAIKGVPIEFDANTLMMWVSF